MANDTVSGKGGVFQGLDQLGTKTASSQAVRDKMSDWTRNNTLTTQHLTGAQKVSAQAGTNCYIYNVSPVFIHPRRADGFGTFLIPRAPQVGSTIIDKETGQTRKATPEDISGTYRLSEPIVINHSYIRSFPGWNEGKRVPYIEYGEDIAEDLVGCSSKYTPDLVSTGTEWDKNLKTWGVFITYGKRFEELEPQEQERLYAEASQAHVQRCIEKVNKGDILFEQYKVKGRGGPLEIHRKCALFLGEVVNMDYLDRPWVTNRNLGMNQLTGKVDCDFCGTKIKATIAICPACKNVVNPELYEKLRKKKSAEKKAE